MILYLLLLFHQKHCSKQQVNHKWRLKPILGKPHAAHICNLRFILNKLGSWHNRSLHEKYSEVIWAAVWYQELAVDLIFVLCCGYSASSVQIASVTRAAVSTPSSKYRLHTHSSRDVLCIKGRMQVMRCHVMWSCVQKLWVDLRESVLKWDFVQQIMSLIMKFCSLRTRVFYKK